MAITTEHTATHRAFSEPALDVLRWKHGAWAIALLREAFGAEAQPIPADQFESLVATATRALLDDGHDVPESTPNRLVRELVDRRLLTVFYTPDGEKMAQPTSNAQRAIDYVRGLGSEHRMISASRVKTIIEVAKAAAFEASESREERLAELQRQRAELDAEIERLQSGGELATVTPDQFVQAFSNLITQVGGLPTDFLAIGDSLDRLRVEVMEKYRAEQLSRSDIVDLYTDRTSGVLRETPEGRAYLGAHELFLDEALLDGFHANISALLQHPHAQFVSREDKAQARATPNTIAAGMAQVLERRDVIVRTISTRIREYDALRRKELMEALDRADEAATAALGRGSGRWRQELPMMPERVQIRGWLKSYPDRTTRSRPKPLRSALTGPAPTLSWEEIRKLSGPRFREIDAAIRAARAAGGSTVGAVIEHLPHDTRRPVDLLGIIHRGVLASAAERETIRTVRGDGSVVYYSIPLISILAEETHHA